MKKIEDGGAIADDKTSCFPICGSVSALSVGTYHPDCHFHTVGRRKTLFINNGFVPVLFLSFCDRLPAASIFAMVLPLLFLTPSTTAFNAGMQRVEANFRLPRVDISTQGMKLEGLLPSHRPVLSPRTRLIPLIPFFSQTDYQLHHPRHILSISSHRQPNRFTIRTVRP